MRGRPTHGAWKGANARCWRASAFLIRTETEAMAKRKPGEWLRRLTREGPRDRAELVEMLRAATRTGVLDADALAMFQGVLRVSDLQVRDIMVPRSQMVVLERDAGPQSLLPAVIESGHSRFPVIGDDRDQIVGILLAKDLLRYYAEGANAAFDIREVLRPAAFVPESKRLNVLLKEFRASRNHMAIVVDEYGGVSGLVTIEDVIEEIVGEIADEYDTEEDQTIRRDGERQFVVQALTRVQEFNDYFSSRFSDEEYDTIGGLVMHQFGRLPRRGEAVTIDGLEFKVLRADRRRIDQLRVTTAEPVPARPGEPRGT
jgi:magnesium and cobalt transporter